MVREIGSEFWREEHRGTGVRPLMSRWDSAILTLCGRTALELIVEDILLSAQPERVYMPSYCCHTMIEPFIRHGIAVDFYDVYATEDGIRCDYRENSCDIVFLIDYFGFSDPRTKAFAEQERQRGKKVVYDTTHALFGTAAPYEADYVLGSFRKWFGVNAGFAAKTSPWTAAPCMGQFTAYCELRNRAFDLKARYIDNPEPEAKTAFLDLSREAGELLERDYHHFAPDPRSLEVLERVDVEEIRRKRRENAAILIEGLGSLEGLMLPYHAVGPNDCPLFVPVCYGDRNGLRRRLIDEQIYCPAHWPVSPLHRLNDRSRQLYDTELSIVCDQRYDARNMERIVENVRKYIRND